MSEEEEGHQIPVKRVKIGTFETERTEVLKITQNSLYFECEAAKLLRVQVLKADVIGADYSFSSKSNYICLELHQEAVQEISNFLPKSERFCRRSKNPLRNRLVLQLAGEVEDLSRAFIESFFEGIPSAGNMNADEMDETNVIDSTEKLELAKKKGSDVEDGENIPPATKKSRVNQKKSESVRQTRNLRSRGNSKKCIKIDSLDYTTDDDEIPEELRVPDESLLTVASKTPSRFDRFEHFENTIQLLVYRGITIQMEDYKCLDRRELVTNFVLDFYLEYFFHECLPEELRKRVHIYKTHFYTLLSTNSNYLGWKDEGIKGLKAHQKRYERVKDIDSEIKIFDKDFIIFPCLNNNHWFLAIACYPRLNGAVTIDGNEIIEDEEERIRDMKNPNAGKPLKASCILIMDSVQSNTSRKTRAMFHIRNFLRSEYEAKYHADFALEASNIIMNAPKCPQQSNVFDCGLFVLEFVEQFLVKSPITDFRIPMNLSNWFDPNIISEKREAIAEVIKKKIREESNGQDLPMLPDISFYKDSDDLEILGPVDCVNGNFDENNENFEENNGNGNDNNNQEEFNNNNDFNAIDNNIHPMVQEISSEDLFDRSIQENPVTSTTNENEENVPLSPPQSPMLFESEELKENGNGDDVTVILDSD